MTTPLPNPATLQGLGNLSNLASFSQTLQRTNGLSDNSVINTIATTQAPQTVLAAITGQGVPKYQQDFPPAARALPMLRSGKLVRGSIYQDKNDPLVNYRPLGFQFLYNPTEWEVDYSLDTSRYPTQSAPQAGSNLPTLGVPGAASLSFNLILDRTWDVNNPRAGMAYKYGINVDVAQFQKMVGYSAKSPFIQAVALRLVFSPTLNYYGFITNFAVLYSQFTTNMRCYRGGITGITFQILPDQAGLANQGQALAAAQNIFGAGVTTPVAGGTSDVAASTASASADSGTGRGSSSRTTRVVALP